HGSIHEAEGKFAEAATTYNAAACLWKQNIELSYRLAGARSDAAMLKNVDANTRLTLLVSALDSLRDARVRVSRCYIWRRILRSYGWRSRDPGERRFWYSWLKADPFRSPLKLLRKSKR